MSKHFVQNIHQNVPLDLERPASKSTFYLPVMLVNEGVFGIVSPSLESNTLSLAIFIREKR